jgi:hypothetical protein
MAPKLILFGGEKIRNGRTTKTLHPLYGVLFGANQLRHRTRTFSQEREYVERLYTPVARQLVDGTHPAHTPSALAISF